MPAGVEVHDAKGRQLPGQLSRLKSLVAAHIDGAKEDHGGHAVSLTSASARGNPTFRTDLLTFMRDFLRLHARRSLVCCRARLLDRFDNIVNAELCRKALEKVGNPNVLVNLVSRRVRQLNAGAVAWAGP